MKVLITLAESVQEALSDFVGYGKNNDLIIDENSICKLSEVEQKTQYNLTEVFNIIDYNEELPEDFDGWFAVDATPIVAMPTYEEWCAGIERVSLEEYQAGIRMA